MAKQRPPRRERVERDIYRQPNGKLAVCARHAGRGTRRHRALGGRQRSARRSAKPFP